MPVIPILGGTLRLGMGDAQYVCIRLGNHVYRYELVDNKLVSPKLILELTAIPGPFHNGGKILIGLDKSVYAVIGDLLYHRTQAQNMASGGPPDL